jgi:hypothetical protein
LIALVAKARDFQSTRFETEKRKTSFASPFFAGLVAFAR